MSKICRLVFAQDLSKVFSHYVNQCHRYLKVYAGLDPLHRWFVHMTGNFFSIRLPGMLVNSHDARTNLHQKKWSNRKERDVYYLSFNFKSHLTSILHNSSENSDRKPVPHSDKECQKFADIFANHHIRCVEITLQSPSRPKNQIPR